MGIDSNFPNPLNWRNHPLSFHTPKVSPDKKKAPRIVSPSGNVGLSYDKQYELNGVKMVPVSIVIKGDLPVELADKLSDLAIKALG